MKKIYSILALAAFMLGAGEANAQIGYYKVDSQATVAEINKLLEEDELGIGEIDVTGVTTDLTGEEIKLEGVNKNTIILAKSPDQVANKVNVVVSWGTKNGQPYYGCEHFVLTDGYPFYATRAFDAIDLEYTRKVSNAYNTVIVPVCFVYEDMIAQRPGQHFEVVDEIDGNVIKCKPIDLINVAPYKENLHHVYGGTPLIVHLHDFAENPYITIKQHNACVNVKAPAELPEAVYTLSGKYEDSSIEAGNATKCYIQDNQFWSAADFDVDVKVPAYRCVFSAPEGSNVKSFSIVSEEATAIKSVATSTISTEAYNLQGVRVAPTAKGFVIMNGKKYFNK